VAKTKNYKMRVLECTQPQISEYADRHATRSSKVL